jgi:hypothetical protein
MAAARRRFSDKSGGAPRTLSGGASRAGFKKPNGVRGRANRRDGFARSRALFSDSCARSGATAQVKVRDRPRASAFAAHLKSPVDHCRRGPQGDRCGRSCECHAVLKGGASSVSIVGTD